MGAIERFTESYHEQCGKLSGRQHDWVNALREQALERFKNDGWPNPKVEDWKYTPLDKIADTDYLLGRNPQPGITDEQVQLLMPEGFTGHRLVFIDGCYTESLSQITVLPPGVVLGSLAGVLEHNIGEVEALLRSIADFEGHPLAALNTAFMEQGLYLFVPRDVQLPEPVYCLFISTASAQPRASYPRLLLATGEHSRVTLIEDYYGVEGSSNFTDALTEVRLGVNARVDHYKLQREAMSASHIAGLHVEQQRGSRFNSHTFFTGAALARNDIHIKLNAKGASCCLNGLYLTGERQHVDHHTHVEHLQPECRSDELYKGIVQERARAVFNGKVVVHPQAQQTDARQLNKNLLLSPNAEVDTKPELQIYADDVKCSHGATVGQLDPLQLFYLQSRGIEEKDAEALLTYGFVSEMVERIDDPVLERWIRDYAVDSIGMLTGGDVSGEPIGGANAREGL